MVIKMGTIRIGNKLYKASNVQEAVIAQQELSKLMRDKIKESKIYDTDEDKLRLEKVVASLPFIGLVGAKAILSEYKSIRRIFNLSASEFDKIKGISKQEAQQLEEFINATYR